MPQDQRELQQSLTDQAHSEDGNGETAVTESQDDNLQCPTTAECHCGRELLRATVADPQTVANHV